MESKQKGKYFVALLPDDKTSELVNSIRHSLASNIEVSGLPIHLTLKESFFSDRIDDCVNSLTESYSALQPLKINLIRYDKFHDNHLVITVERTHEIRKLHEKTMEVCQEFAEFSQKRFDLDKLSPEQRVLLEKFNNPFSFDFYNPHITIGRVRNEQSWSYVNDFMSSNPVSGSFVVKEVAVIDRLQEKVYCRIPLG